MTSGTDKVPASSTARYAPAAARNRAPILEVLRRHLPTVGRVLEIASGTGEHAVHFAAALPGIIWQPTDINAEAIASIEAHRSAAKLANLREPIYFDVSDQPWPVDQFDAVVAINMIHISPWEAGAALIEGAGRILPPDRKLILYGPFKHGGRHNALSNEAFDADLRSRNPHWGIRDSEEVEATAALHGMHMSERVAMPANNFMLVFQKGEAARSVSP